MRPKPEQQVQSYREKNEAEVIGDSIKTSHQGFHQAGRGLQNL
jgi:hypothetical protein